MRSFYYQMIRILVRDFSYNLNRIGLLKKAKMEDINVILTKRTSMFLFNILHHLSPTGLAGILISKSYENERTLGKLAFFDCSKSKFGKAAISNAAKLTIDKWRFDWLFLTQYQFKIRLREQFQLSM